MGSLNRRSSGLQSEELNSIFLRAVLVGQSQKADAGEFGLWSEEPF